MSKLHFTVDEDRLSEYLSDGLSRKDLIKLIKNLDEHQADWDFTLELFNHFAALNAEWMVEKEEIIRKDTK